MSVAIAGAAARLLTVSVDGYAPGRNRPGFCLRWNYFAFGLTPNLSPAAIAMDAWNYAPAEHRHPIGPNTVIPANVPIILGPSPTRTDSARNAGDVFPALGGVGLQSGGNVTDSPHLGSGRIGPATIAQRAAQTQRPVLGYLTWWLGYELAVDVPAVQAAPSTTPSDPTVQEDDMAQLIGIKGGSKPGLYMVDFGRRTYWNVIKGCASVSDAMTRVNVWKAMGVPMHDQQSPLLIAGFNDITNSVEA